MVISDLQCFTLLSSRPLLRLLFLFQLEDQYKVIHENTFKGDLGQVRKELVKLKDKNKVGHFPFVVLAKYFN